MTTQQPAALWIAYELEIGTFVPNVLQNEIVLRQNAAAELRRQHARITELEAQLAQRFDAADMATAAAQGFRDGATAPAQPVAEPAKADSVLEDALSDAVRVPLDSLHADAAYLIGRLRDGSMPYVRVIEIIRERIDAAKAAIRARAASAPADSVLEDAARLLALEAAANQIFNNPPSETSQDVRDVIEWFSGSIRVVLDAARKQGEKQ